MYNINIMCKYNNNVFYKVPMSVYYYTVGNKSFTHCCRNPENISLCFILVTRLVGVEFSLKQLGKVITFH